MIAFTLLFLSTACETETADSAASDVTISTEGAAIAGWCDVALIWEARCLTCHGSGAPLGELDLETDPYAALVGVRSPVYGELLVVPGDPEASLLWRKLDGTQGADEGSGMPVGALLSLGERALVRAWIAEGAASAECAGGSGRHHPSDYVLPVVHGIAAKLGAEDCAECHGDDLLGGSVGIGCAGCHDLTATGGDWTEDCTFCHGNPFTGQAAPPEDIDDERDPALISFPEHLAHVEASDTHGGMGCDQCHDMPSSVFSAGHFLVARGDVTPGAAEVFPWVGGEVPSDVIAPAATYAAGTCSEVACHALSGDGGSVSTGQPVACGDCHEVAIGVGLSGAHSIHIDLGTLCADCHPTVQGVVPVISRPVDHADGVVDLELPEGVVYDGVKCWGSCHQYVFDHDKYWE